MCQIGRNPIRRRIYWNSDKTEIFIISVAIKEFIFVNNIFSKGRKNFWLNIRLRAIANARKKNILISRNNLHHLIDRKYFH